MRFKLLLTGGKEVIIPKESKEEIEKALLHKIDTFITVEGELIKTSAIKAILKHDEQGVDPLSQQTREIEAKEWYARCLNNSKLTAEEKAQKELNIRILPGWRLAKLPENDPVLAEIYDVILNFFDKNPLYPRCPMKVWWSLVADKIAPEREIKIGGQIIKKRSNPNVYLGKWFNYIMRNDEAIENWVKYQAGR